MIPVIGTEASRVPGQTLLVCPALFRLPISRKPICRASTVKYHIIAADQVPHLVDPVTLIYSVGTRSPFLRETGPDDGLTKR